MSSVLLPAKFINNRIFVNTTTVDGLRVTLLADTGGAMVVKRQVISGSQLPTFEVNTINNMQFNGVTFPAVRPEAWIPGVSDEDGLWFIIFENDTKQLGEEDGMLGQEWFSDRVWTLDYRQGQLRLGTDIDTASLVPCPLGFLTDSNEKRLASYPRIQARVDGEILDLLFDTGATLTLSEQVHRKLNDGEPPVRGTSFIARSVYERWKTSHPEWRTFEHADVTGDEAIIEVPCVEIGGHQVGPVWFTRRPDTNFHDYMSSVMDKRVEGALGGSVFKFFQIVLDYPNSIAYFWH